MGEVHCISEGLVSNSSKIKNKIYAYDSFSCEENELFKICFEHAKGNNYINLIKTKMEWLIFMMSFTII